MDNEVSRRRLLKCAGLGAVALGSASLLAACGNNGAPAASGAMHKFAVATFPGDAYFLDTINLEKKIYAAHNLEVPKHITPQSGVQAFQLLVAGAIDGYAADTGLLMATHANSSKGKRPVLVGFRNLQTTYGIIGGPDSQWPATEASFDEKMHSLKGKKIGVTAVGAGGDFHVGLALKLAGMKPGDVTVLAVGPHGRDHGCIHVCQIDDGAHRAWCPPLCAIH